MNKEIEELAAREYPILSNNSDHKATQILRQQAFIKGAELSIGFAEWVEDNYFRAPNGTDWCEYLDRTYPMYTTQQLFTKYLNTKK